MSDTVAWKLLNMKPGVYQVIVSQAGSNAWKDNKYKVTLGENQLISSVVPTDSMSEHADQEIGRVNISELDCPMWIFTAEFEGMKGGDTGQLEKVAYNFEFYKAARAADKHIRLTMFSLRRHGCHHLVYYHPGLWEWLFAQKRAQPRSLAKREATVAEKPAGRTQCSQEHRCLGSSTLWANCPGGERETSQY